MNVRVFRVTRQGQGSKRSGAIELTARWAALDVGVTSADGSALSIPVTVRIDTPTEAAYYEHGGILPYVLRALRKGQAPQAKPAVTKETVEHPEPKVDEGAIASFPASDPTSF